MEARAHDYKWVVDKPATEDETGIGHEECVCGVKRNKDTEIPKLEDDSSGATEEEGSEDTEPVIPGMSDQNESAELDKLPKTGQEESTVIWVMLIAAIASGGAGVLFYLKKKGQS